MGPELLDVPQIPPSGTNLVSCSCQYALGGGAVAPGGSFPQAQTITSRCASQLHQYLVRIRHFRVNNIFVQKCCLCLRHRTLSYCCREASRSAYYFRHTTWCLQVSQYDRDVETAIISARAFFDTYPRQANASQIIVLDIDETALSNRAEWLTALEGRRVDSIGPSLQVLLPLQHACIPVNRFIISAHSKPVHYIGT